MEKNDFILCPEDKKVYIFILSKSIDARVGIGFLGLRPDGNVPKGRVCDKILTVNTVNEIIIIFSTIVLKDPCSIIVLDWLCTSDVNLTWLRIIDGAKGTLSF
jgi:hypothetical protein